MKSHVSMEQNRCRICGKDFDTGAILLDKRLKASMDTHTLTGMGVCPEDQRMLDDGYLALIEIDPVKSRAAPGKPMSQETAYRTGRMAWLAATAVKSIFGVSPYSDTGAPLPFLFVEEGVLEKLQGMLPTREVPNDPPASP